MKSAPQHRRDHDGADLRFNLHRLIMADADLSPTAKNCASVLLFGFMSGKTGRCNPSYEEIAEALGISRETAMRGVKALAVAAYVTVHHTFRTVAGAQVHGNNLFEFAFDRLGRHAPNAVPVAERGGVNSDTTLECAPSTGQVEVRD